MIIGISTVLLFTLLPPTTLHDWSPQKDLITVSEGSPDKGAMVNDRLDHWAQLKEEWTFRIYVNETSRKNAQSPCMNSRPKPDVAWKGLHVGGSTEIE